MQHLADVEIFGAAASDHKKEFLIAQHRQNAREAMY